MSDGYIEIARCTKQRRGLGTTYWASGFGEAYAALKAWLDRHRLGFLLIVPAELGCHEEVAFGFADETDHLAFFVTWSDQTNERNIFHDFSLDWLWERDLNGYRLTQDLHEEEEAFMARYLTPSTADRIGYWGE